MDPIVYRMYVRYAELFRSPADNCRSRIEPLHKCQLPAGPKEYVLNGLACVLQWVLWNESTSSRHQYSPSTGGRTATDEVPSVDTEFVFVAPGSASSVREGGVQA